MTAICMGNTKWIRCAEQPNTYCYARGQIDIPAMPIRGRLEIVADSRYQVWSNGRYIGQGPSPYKRPYIFFDSCDIGQGEVKFFPRMVAPLEEFHEAPVAFVEGCGQPSPGPPRAIVKLETYQYAPDLSHKHGTY